MMTTETIFMLLPFVFALFYYLGVKHGVYLTNKKKDILSKDNLSSCIVYLIFEIGILSQIEKEKGIEKTFLLNLMKYRPYEVEEMLREQFLGIKYLPSTAIIEKDNEALKEKVKFILDNFEDLMADYFSKKYKTNKV